MFKRQLMTAAFVLAVLACAGCHCCGKRCNYAPPCPCGPAVPAGPVAVPAPVAAAAPCPNCPVP